MLCILIVNQLINTTKNVLKVRKNYFVNLSGVQVVSVSPVIKEAVPNFLVDIAKNLHVRFPPVLAQVLCL